FSQRDCSLRELYGAPTHRLSPALCFLASFLLCFFASPPISFPSPPTLASPAPPLPTAPSSPVSPAPSDRSPALVLPAAARAAPAQNSASLHSATSAHTAPHPPHRRRSSSPHLQFGSDRESGSAAFVSTPRSHP